MFTPSSIIDNTPAFACEAKQSQSGFSLLEISVALMLLAAVTLGYLYNQSRQSLGPHPSRLLPSGECGRNTVHEQ